ncbi:MAG: hypothetical protein ACT4PW_05780 [Acidimicrobiia bacterium]
MEEAPEFDQAVASRLCDELLRVALSLRTALGVLADDLSVVALDWSGPYRDDFDPRLAALIGCGRANVEALVVTAAAVRAGMVQAMAELVARADAGRSEQEAATTLMVAGGPVED